MSRGAARTAGVRRQDLAWKQVDDPGLGARRWTLAGAVEQARTEPWAGLPRRGRSLGPARRRLDDMRS
ncbi:hypothetical protein GCM10010236_31970 [Streptomyces eurythermus]|nr:hypothetical protein GCM10010236_31970 [Streptomyces eurythermus]